MRRPAALALFVGAICLLLGVAGSALVFAYLPDPGSPPSIYDDFQWSSTSNGFWHVNSLGSKVIIKHSLLTIEGHTTELDRRFQTDPYRTILVAKVRGLHFYKFSVGLGESRAGTVDLEFDNDGFKCGRGSDYGWAVDIMRRWTTPPAGQWFYLEVSLANPYPTAEALATVETEASKRDNYHLVKTSKLTCSVYDAAGHLIASSTPQDPPPNTHYAALDEALIHTWDSGNEYQVDWLYAGPPSGLPGRVKLAGL